MDDKAMLRSFEEDVDNAFKARFAFPDWETGAAYLTLDFEDHSQSMPDIWHLDGYKYALMHAMRLLDAPARPSIPVGLAPHHVARAEDCLRAGNAYTLVWYAFTARRGHVEPAGIG